MRIVQTQDFLKRQSETYIRGELSTIASVVSTPQVFVEYFAINPDKSITMDGLQNVEDFIGQHSTVVYDLIKGLPIAGISDLVMQTQFDEELGHDEDFTSEGIILPNTIVPKEDDCFLIRGQQHTALYKVTEVTHTTVRSNPFTGIGFRLYSRDPELIKQLYRQVDTNYVVTTRSVGLNRSLVVAEENLLDIEGHVKQYLEILELYKLLFYDNQRYMFIYNGIPGEDGNRYSFIDVVMWKVMFDEQLCLFDQIATYGINNFNLQPDRIYAGLPDRYITQAEVARSIFYRVMMRDHKNDIAEYKYPQAYDPDPRVGKYTGKFLYFFKNYGKECDCNLMCTTAPVWDEEFVARIKANDPYPEVRIEQVTSLGRETCCMPSEPNPYEGHSIPLRNAVIRWYNNKSIDWENLEIEQKISTDNFYLIPIILYAYRDYIQKLQK